MLTSFIESRTNDNDSIGICFVDLLKTFDRVLRELVMGWPAIWIVNWITKRRPLFEEWEVHHTIGALVKNLHDGCWLAYDDLSTVVLCPTGVRQVFETGPKLLNCIYQLDTEAVKDKLRDEGIVMSLPRWLLRGHDRNGEEILDVYFVDDGSCMIAHKQAAELVKRMRLLVATIVSIFSGFQMSVNMAKGRRRSCWLLGTRTQRLSERSCVAPMDRGWTLVMMRDRCIARCMSSLNTNTWERG